jgi:hypothetical protein
MLEKALGTVLSQCLADVLTRSFTNSMNED